MTALVLCAHGTRDPEGRAVIRGIVDDVAAALPGVAVHEAYVDVHGPELGDVLAALPRAGGPGPSGVVVPLLLAAGYHVHVDLADAVRPRPGVVVTAALGPDDRLVDILVDRMTDAGVAADAAVVLAPAGSSDARAQADSAEMARRLGERVGRLVSLGYAAGPAPSVADAVATLRAGGEVPRGHDALGGDEVHGGDDELSVGGVAGAQAAGAAGAAAVVVVSYLLAPGFFQRRLGSSGADVVTGPLAPDSRIVDIVLDRYSAALSISIPNR
jgi:sirohydrochlorin ferrochelatase